MAYFVAILTPDSAWSCVVIIVAVVIVAVLLVVVIDAIVEVVIVVANIGVIVVVIIGIVVIVDDGVSRIIKLSFVIIGISLGPVFQLGLSAFVMAAACASRAATTPSVISCRMVASVIASVADVNVLLGGIYQHIHANT
nr:hypothetical protein [Tanacetum cinerariifolium]